MLQKHNTPFVKRLGAKKTGGSARPSTRYGEHKDTAPVHKAGTAAVEPAKTEAQKSATVREQKPETERKPVAYKPGDVVTLKVLRESEFGVFLDAGTGCTDDDILLHKLQQTEPVKVGDMVQVYLYLDPHHRLTASMKLPKMKEGQLGYARVLNITKDGGFVDLGAERGVFLPYSEMRGHVSPDQKVWVKLYRDKSGRPAVTMRVEKDIALAARKAQDVKVGDMVTGTIYNILDDGFFLFTTDRYIGFLHRSEAPANRRLDFGEQLTCRVTHIREDGHINLSLRPQKEDALVSDAAALYELMQKRGGRMPYCDDTPKEIIKEKFGLSKAAFKRALGHLMKEDKIVQEDGWTILK
jgi:predicted RNA-binding protein (virulence factor B family)